MEDKIFFNIEKKLKNLIGRKVNMTDKSSYIGFFDNISDLVVTGWAYNKNNPEERVEVVVLVDGRSVAEVVADQYSEDLKQAGIGDGKHAFKCRISDTYADGKEHEVRVVVKNTGKDLDKSPQKITIKTSKKLLYPVIGFVENLEVDKISGWAVNLDDPFKQLTVKLVVGDEVIIERLCNIERKDVVNNLQLLESSFENLDALLAGFKFFITEDIAKKILSISQAEEIPFKITAENNELHTVNKNKELKFKREDLLKIARGIYYKLKDYSYIVIKAKEEAHQSELEIQSQKAKDVKLIAFYLPQFYPFHENNEWWGEGFTEWSQVVSAKPLFEGHYQPRLPADLGFYDLRLQEVRKKQENLAKEYGIYGFCYYYYWFSGRILMDEITRDILESGVPDLPFCLCWANEPWSRRWDGSDQEVLMPQPHDLDTDERFIVDIMPYLKDPRYIKVNNKPMVIVYNIGRLPDPKKLFESWRQIAKAEGFPDLHIVMAETFGISEPYKYGCDAAVEFPPHKVVSPEISKKVLTDKKETDFQGAIYDYREVVATEILKNSPGYIIYRTLMTGWDNSPRRGQSAHIFHYASPEYYEIWLRNLVDYTKKHLPEEHRFIFINAWNEWAEGTYLEPDKQYGKTYLQATKKAIHGSVNVDSILTELQLYLKENEKVYEYIKNYIKSLEKVYRIVLNQYESIYNLHNVKHSKPMLFNSKFNYNDGTLKIKYTIERVNQYVLDIPKKIIINNKLPIEIDGWLAIAQDYISEFKIEDVFIGVEGQNNRQNFIFHIKNRFIREDVNRTLNINANCLSGFNVLLDLESVPEDLYSMKFLVTDGNKWLYVDIPVMLYFLM